MDPNIIKLLEEDEDETMHSGADVDAFTAELNRDIEGSTYSSQHLPSEQHSSPMEIQQHGPGPKREEYSEGSSNELDPMPHSSSGPQPQDGQNAIREPKLEEQDESCMHRVQSTIGNQFTGRVSNYVQPMSVETSNQQSLSIDSHVNQDSTNVGTSTMNRSSVGMGMSSSQQSVTSAMMAGQQPMSNSNQQQGAALKLNKQVPFGMLLPIIQPQLDKDRAMQLDTLYLKLKKNEISKDGFIRHIKSIVGDQMLRMAVYKLKTQAARNSQGAPSQLQLQPHAGRQAPSNQVLSDSNNQINDSNFTKPCEMENLSTSQGLVSVARPGALSQDTKRSTFPTQGLNKQQNMHFSQTSFPTYASAGNSYPPYSGNVTPSSASPGQHLLSSQMSQSNRLGPSNQGLNTTNMPSRIQPGGPTHLSNNSGLQRNQVQHPSSTSQEQKVDIASSLSHIKHETFDHSNEQRVQFSSSHSLSSGPVRQGNLGPGRDESFEIQSSRMGLTSGPVPTNSVFSSISSQMDTNLLSNSRMPSLTAPIGSGNISKATPQRKPVVGQKKPMETSGSSSPSSKKQKVSGVHLDQSIEHLNDVTAVSGVDLREEEEQLFSGPKEDSRVSEASRRVVQEEEERLILNKIPLQKKVVQTMAKFGLKNMGSDAMRCLSLCVEERMRGLISNAIRLSKQRADIEKSRHRTIVTSDVRQQILSINNKARDEWEKKQAETENSQNPNDPEDNSNGADVDKEKDESRGKSTKTIKEDDDKMRATAANVAVRAATGVGDMLSRWQLMIEAKLKQVGSGACSSKTDKDVSKKTPLTTTRNTRENQEGEKRDSSSSVLMTQASIRKAGCNPVVEPKVARSISVDDVIAVLEREPQMSKSPLVYRLYNRVTATDQSTTNG